MVINIIKIIIAALIVLLMMPMAFADSSPIVTLIEPDDNFISFGSLTESFVFFSEDDIGIEQCRLYTNESGVFQIDEITNFLEPAIITADSLIISAGSIDSGTVNDTHELDNIIMFLSEVTGVPGFNYTFNFTDGIDENESINVSMFGEYTGSTGHTVNERIWNYTSGSWLQLRQIENTGVNSWYNATVSNSSDVMMNGIVLINYLHPSGGSPLHDLSIDYLFIEAMVNPTNNTNQIIHTFDESGVYSWNIECIDTGNNASFSNENRTLILGADESSLVLICLRDGVCDGWWIKDRFDDAQRFRENLLLITIFIIIMTGAWIESHKDEENEDMETTTVEEM